MIREYRLPCQWFRFFFTLSGVKTSCCCQHMLLPCSVLVKHSTFLMRAVVVSCNITSYQLMSRRKSRSGAREGGTFRSIGLAARKSGGTSDRGLSFSVTCLRFRFAKCFVKQLHTYSCRCFYFHVLILLALETNCLTQLTGSKTPG